CLRAGTAEVDLEATERRRTELRAQRLAEGRPWDTLPTRREDAARPPGGAPSENGVVTATGPGIPLGHALLATPTNRGWRYNCQGCGHDYGSARHPKEAACWRAVPMTTLSRWNRFGLVDEIAVREY